MPLVTIVYFVYSQIALSDDDLTVVMKILLENLGEAASQSGATQQTQQEAQKTKREEVQCASGFHEGRLQ